MGGNASPGKVNFTAGLSLFLKEKQQQRFVPLQDLQQSCCTNGKDQDNQNVINLQKMSSSLWKYKVQVDQESAWHSSALSRYCHFVVDVQLVVDVTSMMFDFIQT